MWRWADGSLLYLSTAHYRHLAECFLRRYGGSRKAASVSGPPASQTFLFLCTDMFNPLIFANVIVTHEKGRGGRRRKGLSEGEVHLLFHAFNVKTTNVLLYIKTFQIWLQYEKAKEKKKRILALCKNGLQCFKGWEVSSRWVALYFFFHILAFYF